MKTRDFCFWLMGSLELNENEGLNEKQTQILKNHLDMVFVHMVNDDGTLKDEVITPRQTSGVIFTGGLSEINC